MRPSDVFGLKIGRYGGRGIGVLVASILALAMIGGALSGCGGGTEPATTTEVAPGTTTTGETPTTAGTEPGGITLQTTTPAGTGTVEHIDWNVLGGEPRGLDPLRVGVYTDTFISAQIYDTLLRYSTDWELGPCIAESWQQPDDLTFIFAIRQDAKFWDGNPVTADDVVFSLTRQKDGAMMGGYYADVFKYVTSIEKTAPSEVTVKLSRPDALFAKMLAVTPGMIVEKAFVDAAGEAYGTGVSVMGSGPYKVTAWNTGSNIELEAVAGYWDPDLQPKVQAVTIQFLTDSGTVASAFMSGELDGMYEAPWSAIPALQAAPDAPGKLYYGPALQVTVAAPVNPAGPIGNVNIRKALSMAIDKQSIVDQVYYGAAATCKTASSQGNWYPEAMQLFEDAYAALPSDQPDIEAAKALVAAEAGAATPMTVGFPVGDQAALQIASIIQQAAKDIGLTVELLPMQPMDYIGAFYVPALRQGIDILLTFGYSNIPDPLATTVLLVGPTALMNWLGWSNAEAEQKLDQAYQTYDPVARAQLVVEAQKVYTEDYMTIPLTSGVEILYMSDRISGAPVNYTYMALPSLAMLGGTK